MSRSTKNMLALLLIITLVISFVGTLAAIMSLSAQNVVPVSGSSPQLATGRVSVYIPQPPVSRVGEVLVNVLPSEEGGK